jgi:hypothetical protein
MERSIYTNNDVATFYNANFINVKLDMEIGEGIKLAEQFQIEAYPTLLFIDPVSLKVVHKSVGAMEVTEFISFGKDAKDPKTRYYNLKVRVKANAISDSEFVKWATYAKRLNDDDLMSYVNSFLSKKPNILSNEHVATVTLKYARLSDDQLRFLVKNESKLKDLFKVSEREAWRMVYDKLMNIALKVYNENTSEKEFEEVFMKFDLSKLNFATKDLQVRIAIHIKEDSDKACRLLMQYMSSLDSLTVQETAELFVDNLESFTESNFKIMSNSLKKIEQSRSNESSWLWFMQAVAYYLSGEKSEAVLYAKKYFKLMYYLKNIFQLFTTSSKDVL